MRGYKYDTNTMAFRSWIDRVMKNEGLSVNELSEKLGVSRSTIWRWKQDVSLINRRRLAGIIYMLRLDEDLSELCKEFGIA